MGATASVVPAHLADAEEEQPDEAYGDDGDEVVIEVLYVRDAPRGPERSRRDAGDFVVALSLVRRRTTVVGDRSEGGLSVDGFGPLHRACLAGDKNLDRLTELLSAASVDDVNAAAGDGVTTPLVLACRHGHARVARCLLRAGAEPVVALAPAAEQPEVTHKCREMTCLKLIRSIWR